MTTYYVDANIFLRFFLKDIKKQYKEAEEMFEKAKQGKVDLVVADVTIFEVVHVLESVYKETRQAIATLLDSVIKSNYINVVSKDVFVEAFEIYSNCSVDIVDAYLFVVAKNDNSKVFTFDSDFKKIGRYKAKD